MRTLSHRPVVTFFIGFSLIAAGWASALQAEVDEATPSKTASTEDASQDDTSDAKPADADKPKIDATATDREPAESTESTEAADGEESAAEEAEEEAEEEHPSTAETYEMKPTETKAEFALQPADTSSPRATLRSFTKACNRAYDFIQTMGPGRSPANKHEILADVDRIMRCLDLSGTPEYLRDSIGRESAVCLKEVLDRIDWPNDIPGKDELRDKTTDDPINYWRVPQTDIVLARVLEGPREGEYLFSADTVKGATRFYNRAAHLPYRTAEPWDGPHYFIPAVSPGFYKWFLSEPGSPWLAKLVHTLPDWLRDRILGQAAWQWVGLFAACLVGFVVMMLAYRMGRWKNLKIRGTSVLRYCITLLFPVAAVAVPIYVEQFIADQLVVSGTVLAVVKFGTGIAFLIAIVVVIMSAGNRISEVIISSPKIHHPQGLDAQLVRIVTRVISLATAVVVFLEGGKYLGVPLTTLLAGAGVGGIAVALSAQDTLKNIFGSVMIILDKPYRIGERIAIKNYDGVVEEIGLRSTKIRLLTGHLASIPNEEMARSDIENIGRRPHIRRIADIKIPLDTSPEKAQEAVNIVRNIFADHEGQAETHPPRVFLSDFDRDALNIRIIYWYHPAEYWEFMRVSEELNLRIMNELNAAGISFALPASTVQVTREDGASAAPSETKAE